MLAHQHGLALITEKLQNQRLEEPAGGSSGVAPSGASTSSSFCGKLPAVGQDSYLICDHPGQSATALSVKGKNVWTLSLEADHHPGHPHPHQDTTTPTSRQPPPLHPPPILQTSSSSSPRSILPSMCRHKKLRHMCQICDTSPGTPSAPPKKKHCRSLSVPPDGPSTAAFFPSGKDSFSSSSSSTSPCTRFSIGIGGQQGVGHGATHGSQHHSSHHPHHHYHHHSYHNHHHHHHHNQSSSSCHHGLNIWRPIAVVPLRGASAATSNNINNNNNNINNNNNNAGSGGGGGGGSNKSNKNSSSYNKSKGGKERMSNNPALHHYPPPAANFGYSSSASTNNNNYNDDNNNNNNSSSINNSSILTTSVSGFYDNNNSNDSVDYNNSVPTPHPSSASSRSYSSSTSSSSLLKLNKLMPPSASSSASFDSGHCTTSDLQTPPSSPIPQPRPASAASDTSYGSAGCWFDFSPMRSRLSVLQNRSLSCEDRISACSSCCSSSSPSPFSFSSSSTSGTTTSMPCVYNCSNTNSIGVGTGADGDGSGSSVGRAGGGGSSAGAGRGTSVGACCPHHGNAGLGEIVPRCHSQPCVLHHRRCGKKRRRDFDRPTLNFNKMTETAYIPPHPNRKSEPWSSPSFESQMRLWQGLGQYVFNTAGQSQQNPFHLNPIASSPLDSSESFMSRHLQQQQPPNMVVGGGSGGGGGGRIDHGSDRSGRRFDHMSPPDISLGRRSQDEEEEEDEEEEGEEEEDEEEEEEEDERNCSCHDNQRESDSMGVFPMGDLEDLDLEQIETH